MRRTSWGLCVSSAMTPGGEAAGSRICSRHRGLWGPREPGRSYSKWCGSGAPRGTKQISSSRPLPTVLSTQGPREVREVRGLAGTSCLGDEPIDLSFLGGCQAPPRVVIYKCVVMDLSQHILVCNKAACEAGGILTEQI